MFTVTLIGPDGVGKTTVAKALESSFQLPLKYIYMGMNIEASNVMLPTTRWWETRKKKKGISAHVIPADFDAASVEPAENFKDEITEESNSAVTSNTNVIQKVKDTGKFISRAVRKSVGLGNRIMEEWYRQLVAWWYVRRGYIVIFDRHFVYDYYHHDMHPEENKSVSLKRKIHGFLLKHTLREPDLLIILDAPGEVVFARKGEFTPEFLEIKRNQYLELQDVVKNSRVIDATRPLETVVNNVMEAIFQFHQERKNYGRYEKQ